MLTAPGDERLRLAPFGPGDTGAVLAMLERCSPAALYHRFHGITKGAAHAMRLLTGTPGQETFCIWHAGSCVGVAGLVVDAEGSGHVGVLVEDRWQRHGAGWALVEALAGRARELGVSCLVADVLGDRRFLLTLLRRLGPVTTSFVHGGYSARVDLGPADDAGADHAGADQAGWMASAGASRAAREAG